jgi:PilZ domain-containing protein
VERNKKERRREPRHLCSHLLEVIAANGRQEAVLEDLSPEGAAVAVESAIAAGTVVELSAPDFCARAEVRYCLPREGGFRLGLRFTEGFRWQPGVWQPEHLWLPPGSNRPAGQPD